MLCSDVRHCKGKGADEEGGWEIAIGIGIGLKPMKNNEAGESFLFRALHAVFFVLCVFGRAGAWSVVVVGVKKAEAKIMVGDV